MFRIVDRQGEIVARHHPIQLRRDDSQQRNLHAAELALQLVLCTAFHCIQKRRHVTGQFGIRSQNRKDIRVGLAEQFDTMRKSAIASSLVYFQKPDDAAQQREGALGKKISLFFRPCPVQVQQNHVTRFVSVADVFQIFRVERIAPVAFTRVVEVEYMEFGRFVITMKVTSQMIIRDRAQVRVLVIVQQHREPFADLLPDDVIDDGIAFPGTGGPADQNRSERIDDIQSAVVPLLSIVKTSGKVNGAVVVQKTGFLLETFVFHVVSVLHQRNGP